MDQNATKRNVNMSPTSSHCVENDNPIIVYDFENMNLTQPTRNLYKSKNPTNLKNIDETTSLCIPFKAMTSPSTRNPRNGSLLAKLNEITDKIKDTSPPDLLTPYQARKFVQNDCDEADNESIANQVNNLFPTVQSRQGDGSNCSSSVSRFITTQQSGFMNKKFDASRMQNQYPIRKSNYS